MAGNIYQWSTTAASNGTADADVPWPEGMARRQVNNSARSLMGRVAEILGDMGGALSAGGTPNGLTVTANSAFTTYENGRIVSFRATADNSGAATLSVNAIGAKSIRKMDSTGDVALAAGDIKNTGLYVAQYSAALNGAAGAWLLVNPTLSAAIYALSSLVTVDNTVPRFNGTAGALQTSSVTIDDSNNVSGIGTLTTTGNITTTGGNIQADLSFIGEGNVVLATTGANSVFLRPNGFNSTTGQILVAATGDVTISGVGVIHREVNTSGLFLDGGSASGNGAHITLFGGAHGLANQAFHDSNVHNFRTQAGGSGTSVVISGTLTVSG